MGIYTRFSEKNLKLMKQHLSLFKGKVLDVGCGNLIDQIGFIPGDEYIGLDIKMSKHVSILVDVTKMPLKNNSLDCCICNAVLEHVKEPHVILKEVNRVLKPNGLLWVSVPFIQHIHADPYDLRRYTEQGLSYEVENADFSIDYTYGAYGVLDSIEYLLFGAIVYNRNDCKGKQGITDIIYLSFLVFQFAIFKVSSLIFNFRQKKDFHHSVAFYIVAHKKSNK